MVNHTRASLEPGLLTAIDLAASLAGPAAGHPWMPVAVESPTPPAVRVLAPHGSVLPMAAEAGIVLAGPGPRQAVRHMIAAYAPEVAGQALVAGDGNHLGVFGGEVVELRRVPDTLPVGEVRTTVRLTAADGLTSQVVLWRRGPLVAHLAVSGDEILAGMLLGHATRVADVRLAHLLVAGTTPP
jgi:hypothetical protein